MTDDILILFRTFRRLQSQITSIFDRHAHPLRGCPKAFYFCRLFQFWVLFRVMSHGQLRKTNSAIEMMAYPVFSQNHRNSCIPSWLAPNSDVPPSVGVGRCSRLPSSSIIMIIFIHNPLCRLPAARRTFSRHCHRLNNNIIIMSFNLWRAPSFWRSIISVETWRVSTKRFVL